MLICFQFTVAKYIGIVMRLQISFTLLSNDLESKQNDINKIIRNQAADMHLHVKLENYLTAIFYRATLI